MKCAILAALMSMIGSRMRVRLQQIAGDVLIWVYMHTAVPVLHILGRGFSFDYSCSACPRIHGWMRAEDAGMHSCEYIPNIQCDRPIEEDCRVCPLFPHGGSAKLPG